MSVESSKPFPKSSIENNSAELESNLILKNHLKNYFSPEFTKSEGFETFAAEILRLLAIIRITFQDEMNPDNELKELIGEI